MIVVTGGAGFIGSNLVRGLNRRGLTDVLVVDELNAPDKHLNLNPLEFRDFVHKEDFLERLEGFRDAGIEAIFHQGACSDTMETDGRFMMATNFEYSKALLHFACDLGVPFVYASSASVYGDGRRGFREERSCEYPLNLYAFSKYAFDRYVRWALGWAKSQVAGLRYFNVYGPQENHKGRMASVAFHFHEQIAESGEMRLFEGSEGFRRDFVHVDDCVGVNLFLLDHPEVSGIFNCGTGNAESFTRIADAMRRVHPDARVETVPFPDALAGKYQEHTEADLTKLREAGYDHSFTGLDQGVERYARLLQETGGRYLPEGG